MLLLKKLPFELKNGFAGSTRPQITLPHMHSMYRLPYLTPVAGCLPSGPEWPPLGERVPQRRRREGFRDEVGSADLRCQVLEPFGTAGEEDGRADRCRFVGGPGVTPLAGLAGIHNSTLGGGRGGALPSFRLSAGDLAPAVSSVPIAPRPALARPTSL